MATAQRLRTELLIFGYFRLFVDHLIPSHIPTDCKSICQQFFGAIETLVTLKTPPPVLHRRYPLALYYHDRRDNKEYEIIMPHGDDTNECLKYDIAKDSWETFTRYPDGFGPACHGIVLQHSTDLVYLVHGHGPVVMATLNLCSNEWHVMFNGRVSDVSSSTNRHNVHTVANPAIFDLGDFYLYSLSYTFGHEAITHLLYDPVAMRWSQARVSGIAHPKYLDNYQFAHIKGKQMLMIIATLYKESGADNHRIWYTHYNSDKHMPKSTATQRSFEWHAFKTTLPVQLDYFSCVVAFDMVLILVHNKAEEIWVLDLDATPYEWRFVKPCNEEQSLPKTSSMCITQNNEILFLRGYRTNASHCKMELFYCLPPDIYTKYCKN